MHKASHTCWPDESPSSHPNRLESREVSGDANHAMMRPFKVRMPPRPKGDASNTIDKKPSGSAKLAKYHSLDIVPLCRDRNRCNQASDDSTCLVQIMWCGAREPRLRDEDEEVDSDCSAVVMAAQRPSKKGRQRYSSPAIWLA